jgi:hypothetical protein
VEFVLKGFSENALTACTSACWVTTLQAEIFEQPMESKPIIITTFSQLQEVFTCLRHQICVNEKGKIAQIGGH